MVSSREGLEAFLRVLGLPYRRLGGDYVVEVAGGRGLGRVGLVVSLQEDVGFVRVAVPTEVEPTEEGLRWLLSENFRAATYKYGLDYEGFVVVVVDAPAEAVGNARALRRLMAEAVEGYRRLVERTVREEEREEG